MTLYVDGTRVLTKTGMKLRGHADQKIDNILFHNFFGGANSDWAAKKDEVPTSWLISPAQTIPCRQC
jgi:hypothetical protein